MPEVSMKYVVAFSSPKRSSKTIETAVSQARSTDAEIVLVRLIPDPGKVGIVAQLISSDRPLDKARMQIDQCVEELKARGIKASGIVKMGEVAQGIIDTAKELGADMLYVGTTSVGGRQFFMMKKDPIVHYLVEHCPISLCLVRHDISAESAVEHDEEVELGE